MAGKVGARCKEEGKKKGSKGKHGNGRGKGLLPRDNISDGKKVDFVKRKNAATRT